MTDPQGAEALIRRLRECVRDVNTWAHMPATTIEMCSLLDQLAAALSGGARPQEPTPHHCTPSDYAAMIAWLQHVEAGESVPAACDADWRTRAGVLWRMLEWATRDDASREAATRMSVRGPSRLSEAAGARPPEPAWLPEAMVRAATATWKDATSDRAVLERDIEEALKAEKEKTDVPD